MTKGVRFQHPKCNSPPFAPYFIILPINIRCVNLFSIDYILLEQNCFSSRFHFGVSRSNDVWHRASCNLLARRMPPNLNLGAGTSSVSVCVCILQSTRYWFSNFQQNEIWGPQTRSCKIAVDIFSVSIIIYFNTKNEFSNCTDEPSYRRQVLIPVSVDWQDI